ncbi:hypothetical protein Tco_0624645 [Tanacetum coccineum]|uniref:Uncharacterized protein n=1 Tax=Tanacetum coccineum TaxID=301880 RepID=A0ABQ4WEK5_9ASTR
MSEVLPARPGREDAFDQWWPLSQELEEASKCRSSLPMCNHASGVPKIRTNAGSTRYMLLIKCDHRKDEDDLMVKKAQPFLCRQRSAPLTAFNAGSEHVGSSSVEH